MPQSYLLLECIDFFCELKRVNEMNWPPCTPSHACTHAHGVCRPWRIDVVWELFSGRGLDFSIKTLHAPCHYRGRGVSGFQKSDTVDEPLQLRDTPLIRDWLRQSIAWSWPGLLKIRHSSRACSFFFYLSHCARRPQVRCTVVTMGIGLD